MVLHQLQEQISDEKFAKIRDDIYGIRAPPSGMSLSVVKLERFLR
jgi:hypothetical protein